METKYHPSSEQWVDTWQHHRMSTGQEHIHKTSQRTVLGKVQENNMRSQDKITLHLFIASENGQREMCLS